MTLLSPIRGLVADRLPLIREGNDASGEDLESVVNGIELARVMTRGARALIEEEELPGDGVRTREDLRQFVKDNAWGHHASCTNRMGPEGDRIAVVDSSFRVYGTRGLRVVDASVFPRSPGSSRHPGLHDQREGERRHRGRRRR